MLDPFPPPPALLQTLSAPLARLFSLPTLPLHIHEVLFAFLLYHSTHAYAAPWLSRKIVPGYYAGFNARTKLNWDVHVVSLVQSCVVNVLALWVMWSDEERSEMGRQERIWGYTGAGGMVQAFAAGYFLWDLCISVMHVDVFGWGLLAHAVSALVVFCLGFRPFVNFYGPTFILYELSSPFLNFHWFFDKVDMTGSRPQFYNGLLLIGTFFCCRLCWGTYQSVAVFRDIFEAVQSPGVLVDAANETVVAALEQSVDGGAEIMRFAGERVVPKWLAYTYLGANITLNGLNFFWFNKMIETVRKRFRPKVVEVKPDAIGGGEVMTSEIDGFVEQVVTVDKTEVRKRRKA